MGTTYLPIRILIADDHEMVREGLQIIMAKVKEVEVIGEAANGEEVVLKTRQLQPDVVLMDAKMPKCTGVEATKIIKTEFPHIGVIALSSYDEESLVMDMLNAGARGYLLKNASKEEITEAIKTVYRDEPYYCKDVNLKLAEIVSRGGYSSRQRLENLFTETERKIIQLICEEYSSKQIASVLNLKTRTIERYREDIMEKMGVMNVAGLVRFAIKKGLYESGERK